MFRSIIMLGLIALVLVGAGILHVTYNKDTGAATVSIDRTKAAHAAEEVIDEAKALEANLEKNSQTTTK